MNEEIVVAAIPVKQLYFNNDFGVYACETEECVPEIELNRYGNFIINGQMPELTLFQKYNMKLVESHSPKYGKSYRVVSIYQEIPSTIEGQHMFLRTILSPSHAEAIIEAYPNEDIISLFKENKIEYERIKGIGAVTYERIKNKIIENLEIQEALIELSQYDISYAMIQKIIKHFNIPVSLAVQRIKENPYILCEVSGLGFIKVDGYARKMGISLDDPARICAAMEYRLKEIEQDGHTWIPLEQAIEEVKSLTGVDADTIKSAIKAENGTMFRIDKDRIGLEKNYYYETMIAKYIKKLMREQFPYTIQNIDEKIRQAEEEVGFTYTDEQKEAVYKVINENVVVISGRAGTGKSTLLKLIMKILSGLPYSACALSGKAAQRITESTGLMASTIHRLLGYRPDGGFSYNSANKLPVVIVNLDEGSMVPLHLFYQLVSAIDPGSKFIILGDIEQLPPIGAGNVMKDLIDSGVIPVAELTQVHRQALRSGILIAANTIREGKQITEHYAKARVIGELQDLYLIPKEDSVEIYDFVKKLCETKKNEIDLMEFQVISPMKSRGTLSTKNLNLMLQEIFNPGEKPKIKINGYDFKVGDKVIQVGNDYDKGVFNGTLGIIKNIDEEEKIAEIQFVGHENTLFYNYGDMENIDMAYALTVHRVQGSQFKFVVFVLDYSAYMLLSKQLVYTGLTRASEKCVMVFDNKALRYAISQNQSSKRNTFLKELLAREVANNEHSDTEDDNQRSETGSE